MSDGASTISSCRTSCAAASRLRGSCPRSRARTTVPLLSRSSRPAPAAGGRDLRGPTLRPSARPWLIVAALFLVTCGMAMPLAAYGVFLPVLSEAFGWSRGAVSTALSINLLMGGLGTASFYLLSAPTIALCFRERRGLALSLVLVGFNLGYVSAGPLAAWIIAEFGWRTAYAALGGGAGLIALLGAVSVRVPRRAETVSADRRDHATAPDGLSLRQALLDPRQWCLSASWLLQGGLVFMVTVHIVPFARDQGLSLAGASLALTTYGAGAFVGRLVGGVASDQLGTLATIRAGFIAMTLAMVVLGWMPSRVAMLGSMAAFGAGFA